MTGDYIADIEAFTPACAQEESDKRLSLAYIRQFEGNVLTRENEIAHVTSSGFVMNRSLTRMLMVFHNIRGNWSWTGGHADGDRDLLGVALREAREETGAEHIEPLSDAIAAVDILINYGHTRRGRYVSAHLHLNVAYILIADENDALAVKPDENSAVRWIPVEDLDGPDFADHDRKLYGKLVERARGMGAR